MKKSLISFLLFFIVGLNIYAFGPMDALRKTRIYLDCSLYARAAEVGFQDAFHRFSVVPRTSGKYRGSQSGALFKAEPKYTLVLGVWVPSEVAPRYKYLDQGNGSLAIPDGHMNYTKEESEQMISILNQLLKGGINRSTNPQYLSGYYDGVWAAYHSFYTPANRNNDFGGYQKIF